MEKAIIHILNYAACYRGNFIESLETLDRKLAGRNMHNVYIFTGDALTSGSMEWIEPMKNKGLRVHFLSEKVCADASFLSKLAKEENAIAFHTHFVTFKQYISVLTASKMRHLPVIMHVHSASQAAGFVKDKIRHVLYKKCYMVACSKAVYDGLCRDYPYNEKCIIDNGVYFDRLDKYETLKNSDFGIDENERILLLFGYDFYIKGVDLAVKAVKDLRDRGHKLSLVISLSTNLEIVEEKIREMMGEVPPFVKLIKARNDVASLYNYADTFLSPSRTEGLPYAVIEASYCNCTTVMSDIPAQKYLNVPYGVWAKNEDYKDLAEKILEAVSLKKEKMDNIDAVKKQMREAYSLDTWADHVIELYDKLLPMNKA